MSQKPRTLTFCRWLDVTLVCKSVDLDPGGNEEYEKEPQAVLPAWPGSVLPRLRTAEAIKNVG
jgi:hypothetical protein